MARDMTEADRQQARFAGLSPAQVAERLDGVSADSVRSWCAAGWLQHVDWRRPGARTPTYSIRWEWVQEFVARGGAHAFVTGRVKPYWWEQSAA